MKMGGLNGSNAKGFCVNPPPLYAKKWRAVPKESIGYSRTRVVVCICILRSLNLVGKGDRCSSWLAIVCFVWAEGAWKGCKEVGCIGFS